jgi:hypothetical protein
MDVGTVARRLKRGLYASVRDLLLDVELFMANATRRGVYERQMAAPYFRWMCSRCIATASAVVDADDLEQPKKELAMVPASRTVASPRTWPWSRLS